MEKQLRLLIHHASETQRFLEGIEPDAFPGLSCALMEIQLAKECGEQMLKQLEDQKDNK